MRHPQETFDSFNDQDCRDWMREQPASSAKPRLGKEGRAGLLLLLAAGAGVLFLTRSSFFVVSEIETRTDGTLPHEFLLETAAIPAGSNTLLVNLEQVRERMEALPSVREATVTRHVPDLISIHVSERSPVAWVSCPPQGVHPEGSGQLVALDRQGVAFPCDRAHHSAASLPIYSVRKVDSPGGSSETALAAANLLEFTGKKPIITAGKILKLHELNDFSVRAEFESGISAIFAVRELDRQLETLELILQDAVLRRRQVASVNLLMEKNVAVSFVEWEAGHQLGTTNTLNPPGILRPIK